ncbi:MAG: AraC family transcriptional regulator [Pseudomonadota bacterium]
MRIDDAWLTHRIALQPRYVFGILSQHAQALLEQLEQSKSTRGRVECLLMAVLHTGSASMDLVCAKLGLSRQTLFRKLKAEGTTFEQVLDQLRHTLALHYPDGKRASVNETAYLVGFSDPAAFSRAFKRWTGCSPRARQARGPVSGSWRHPPCRRTQTGAPGHVILSGFVRSRRHPLSAHNARAAG